MIDLICLPTDAEFDVMHVGLKCKQAIAELTANKAGLLHLITLLE